MSTNEYSGLLAGAVKTAPLFSQFVYELTEPLRVAKERLAHMVRDFDIDEAQGRQLDLIGQRVGLPRDLPVRLTGVYFALDDDGGVGLDYGVWRNKYDPDDGIVSLGDNVYRQVLKAKVLTNHWHGRRGDFYDYFKALMGCFGVSETSIAIREIGPMHVAVLVEKDKTPPIFWELLTRRMLDFVSAGVQVDFIEKHPYFAFDYQTDGLRGFDEGFFY